MDLRALAEQRTQARGGSSRRRQWASDYEYVGLKGEVAVSEALGCPLDTTINTHGGDGGIDSHVVLNVKGEPKSYAIQVKTSRKPGHLIVEAGKAIALAIYVLCRFDDATDKAYPLGWEWGKVLGQAEIADTMRRGVMFHQIPRAKLRGLDELRARLWTPPATALPVQAARKAAREPFVPRCEICQGIAHYGIGAFGSSPGRWFCREHRAPWEGGDGRAGLREKPGGDAASCG